MPFLQLHNVTFDEHVNVSCIGDMVIIERSLPNLDDSLFKT